MNKLIFADEEEKQGGWTLSPKYLHDIQDKLEGYEECPSYEGIELILLVFNGLALPKVNDSNE